jgi:hypothetical protein
VTGYNSASTQPFSVYNPWGTDSTGWAPGHTAYGWFTADAGSLSSNFAAQGMTGTTPAQPPMMPVAVHMADAGRPPMRDAAPVCRSMSCVEHRVAFEHLRPADGDAVFAADAMFW